MVKSMLDEVTVDLLHDDFVELGLNLFVEFFSLGPLEFVFLYIGEDILANLQFEFVSIFQVREFTGDALDSVEIYVWSQ